MSRSPSPVSPGRRRAATQRARRAINSQRFALARRLRRPTGHATGAKSRFSHSVSTKLDALGRVASLFVDTTNYDFTFDAHGLVSGAGALTVERTDATTDRVTRTLLAGVHSIEEKFTAPNGFGELTGYTVRDIKASGGRTIYSLTLLRDGLGRIAEKDETLEGTLTKLTYAYYPSGALKDVRDVTGKTLLVASFAYDENGNRLQEKGPFSTAYGSYEQTDRIRSWSSGTYAWDDLGRLARSNISFLNSTYSYDSLGHLTGVLGKKSGSTRGTNVTYRIDGMGRRIAKYVDSKPERGWLWNGSRIVAETDSSGAVRAHFVWGTKGNVPDYMVVVRGADAGTYKIVADHVGTVREVIDVKTGLAKQRIDYNPDGFGALAINTSTGVPLDTNPGFQPFGFAGGMYDFSTSLLHFGARDYDGVTGRWLSPDPSLFAGGENLYVYAGNDPINFVDTDGHRPGEFQDEIIDYLPGFGAWGIGVQHRADGILMMGRDETARDGERRMAQGVCEMNIGEMAVNGVADISVGVAGLLVTPKPGLGGGSHRAVRTSNVGGQVHHMPSWNALERWSGKPASIKYGSAGGILMSLEDHADTLSWGSTMEAKGYRKMQLDMLNQGMFLDVLAMDVRDVRRIAELRGDPGRYETQIAEAMAFWWSGNW